MFPGDVLFAVKCNPEPRVLRALWNGGIRHFDCASANEVRLVRQLFPAAAIHFMHPVKPRAAIGESVDAGVDDFALDSPHELDKILNETRGTRPPTRLGLFVRLAVPNLGAAHDLTGKFGASVDETARLLRSARPHAARLGVCFHVGSQCLAPVAFRRALELSARAIALSSVPVDVIDVGGGFPAAYADVTPPPLGEIMTEIAQTLKRLRVPSEPRLWAEPGRALVAAGVSVVVQVLLRRGDALYINDGVYGSLSDAGVPGLRFPVRLIRASNGGAPAPTVPFRFFGPTCDSTDRMEGPFLLPANVHEGDWIEIGQLGAYGAALRTAFNGFDRAHLIEVNDRPIIDAHADAAA